MQPKLSSEQLAQELRDRYSYNPLTGQLIHRKRAQRIGKQVGKYPTTSICVDGQLYRMNVHKAIWLWFHGANPQHTIDHIDRNKTNNCIWNLRDADMFDQNRNTLAVRLTVDAVKSIKRRIEKGDKLKDIAADYKVHPGTISSINQGKNWRNVA